MNPVLNHCPVCDAQLIITQLACDVCETSIHGRFTSGRFSLLTADQLAFVELFMRCEGKINRVGQELGLTYPHVRSQLTAVIEAMGYAVGDEPEPVDQLTVLEQVANGELSADEAAGLL